MCNCRWTGFVLAILILVFTIWPTQIFSAIVSFWIVVVAAALLLLHSIFHHRCSCAMCRETGMSRTVPVRHARKTARKRSSRRRK